MRPRRDGSAARRRVLGDENGGDHADELSAFKRTRPQPPVPEPQEPQTATPRPDPDPRAADRPAAPRPPRARAAAAPSTAAAVRTDVGPPALLADEDGVPPYVELLEGELRQANYSVPQELDRRLRALRAHLGVEYPQAQMLRGLIAMRFPVEAAADLRPEMLRFQMLSRRAAQDGQRNVTLQIPLRAAMLDEIDRLNGQARAGKSGPPRRRSLIVGSILWAAAERSETDPDGLRADLGQFDLYEHLARAL